MATGAVLERQAPISLRVVPLQQWVYTLVLFAVAGLFTIYLTRGQSRAELRFRALVLLGGTLGVFAEPFLEYLGGYWNARIGLWTVFTMYGHSIPVWHFPVYYVWLGGFTLIVYEQMQRGSSAATLWRIYGAVFLADIALELPAQHLTSLSAYYGNQPFFGSFMKLPLWYPAVNAAWPIVIAGALQVLPARRPSPAIPFVIVAATFSTYAITAWPTWAALNSQVSAAVSDLTGAITIIFSLALTQIVIRTSTERTQPAIPARDERARHPIATAPPAIERSGYRLAKRHRPAGAQHPGP
jgi:hypothetical protein